MTNGKTCGSLVGGDGKKIALSAPKNFEVILTEIDIRLISAAVFSCQKWNFLNIGTEKDGERLKCTILNLLKRAAGA